MLRGPLKNKTVAYMSHKLSTCSYIHFLIKISCINGLEVSGIIWLLEEDDVDS